MPCWEARAVPACCKQFPPSSRVPVTSCCDCVGFFCLVIPQRRRSGVNGSRKWVYSMHAKKTQGHGRYYSPSAAVDW